MKKIFTFGDSKTEKQKFHQHEELTSMKNIDINKIKGPNKTPFGKIGFKYFIGYKDAKKIRPLCIFDETKFMSFLKKYDRLLQKYNEIWEKL